MDEAWRRTNGGRSDVCATETSSEGGNEGMTNDGKVKRHEATRVMEIQARQHESKKR